ncbi:M14 family zinc carboxypeptidase [Spirochaetota bacterium]
MTFAFISISCKDDSGSQVAVYHNYTELQAFLADIESSYPDITSIKSIGTSVNGRDIPAIVISDNPDVNEMEPRIRLTGYIHGNEKIGGELLLRFIEYLTSNYGSHSDVTDIVNDRYIVIIPMLNPDGAESGSRYNANRVDLNRNFSFQWESLPDSGGFSFSEPESRAIRDYTIETIFHLSATYHSGAVIVNMPFDYDSNSTGGDIPLESNLVEYMGRVYTTSGSFNDNPYLMSIDHVIDGTINGGDWYIITGSLQDWSYMEAGCLDYTVEVATLNPETEEGVEEIFLYNRNSLVGFIKAAGMGVYGKVTDINGISFSNVSVDITGGDLVTTSDGNGYYHKILMPGNYTLNFASDDNLTYSQAITVPGTGGRSLELNVTLSE